MSWDCCTPTGTCQRGHGCPAGCCNNNCEQGRLCPARQLHRVQLDGPHSKGRKATRSVLAHLVKRAAQLVAVLAVLAIWAAASLATKDADDNAQQRTTWTEAA
jgi:hypothetical protein